MTAAPFTRRSKAITVVPVALLSAAWSVSLLTNSAAVGAATGHRHDPLPDGTTVPQQAIQAPASVPIPGQLGMGVPKGSADAVVAGALIAWLGTARPSGRLLPSCLAADAMLSAPAMLAVQAAESSASGTSEAALLLRPLSFADMR